MSMFHANINYYIIIILSPYSFNTVFSIHVYWFIQCLLFSITECGSSDWVIWYQDICCVPLSHNPVPVVARVCFGGCVPNLSVSTHWEVCAELGTCFLDSVTFKNICNNIVNLHVTILFVSRYIYIWLIWQSYTYFSSWGFY